MQSGALYYTYTYYYTYTSHAWILTARAQILSLRALLPEQGNSELERKSGTREHFLVVLTSNSLLRIMFCSRAQNSFGTLGREPRQGGLPRVL